MPHPRPLHPMARKVLSTLRLPGPVHKHFTQVSYPIDLSENTNPYGGDLSDYPPLEPIDLKESYIDLCLKFDQQKGAQENYPRPGPENALFTVGAIDGMDLMLRAFAEPDKDTICLTNPTFPAYEHWARLANIDVQKVPLLGQDFDEFDISQIKKINPKIVFLCDPNNPTATQLKPGLILELCAAIEGFVVVDEAYIEFSTRPSLLPSLKKHPNLVILRTLSKGWGLAGARCGVLLAEETIINTLWYVHIPFGVSTLTQQAVRERLRNPHAIMASWETLRNDRDKLIKELIALPTVSYIYKSQTNFILVQLRHFSKAMETLRRFGICVLDCHNQVENTIRITISTPENNHKAMEAFQKDVQEVA